MCRYRECPSTSLQAAEKAGMSSEQARMLLEMISTAEVKNQLKETTMEACKYGVSDPCTFSPKLMLKMESGYPLSCIKTVLHHGYHGSLHVSRQS